MSSFTTYRKMSTWQLLSGDGNNIRWSHISDEPKTEDQIAAPTQKPRRLLSMSDLLLKGYRKINECNGEKSGSSMFRTGSGKPVVVKQSSLSEASAILGDVVSDQGCSSIVKQGGVHVKGPSMYHTRLENSEVTEQPSQSKTLPTTGGCPKFTGNGGGRLRSPSMYQNGFRNSLALKQSPLSKASSLLSDKGEATVDRGSGVTVDTGQLSEINSGCNFANSMFQTGSGKKVNISTSGLTRAQKLLGLEDNQTHQGFEGTMQQLHANWQSSPHLSMKMGVAEKQSKDSISSLISPLKVRSGTSGSELLEVTPDRVHSISKPSSVKFHTAGGRSISVSSNALQRARSLLGDPELGSFLNEGDAGEPVFSIFKDRKSDENLNKLDGPHTCISDQNSVTSKQVSKNFISPLRPASSQKQSLVNVGSGKNLIGNFDAEVHESTGYNDFKGCRKCPADNYPSVHTAHEHSLTTGTGLRYDPLKKPPGWPLVDITNTNDMGNRSNKQDVAVKRIMKRRSSGSPFKRPRFSKFITPLTNEIPLVDKGSLVLAPEESSYKNKVSSRYPFQAPRKYVKEYFGVPPCVNTTLAHLPECIRTMNPDRAEQHCFPGGCGFNSIGKEAFSHMLLQSGASMKHISETWVFNHYKWIVWKLACYERCYPGRYLTASNVMEELKYRYEREINHGHRSAIKRILEGDAPPSSVLVQCISSVQSKTDAMLENISTTHGVDSSTVANVELTDGWYMSGTLLLLYSYVSVDTQSYLLHGYSVNAVLDAPLSKKLASGKLFVGQKIKISGAGLCGWAGTVSPLELA